LFFWVTQGRSAERPYIVFPSTIPWLKKITTQVARIFKIQNSYILLQQ